MDYTQDWMNTRSITPEWNDECAQYYVKYVDGTATYEIWVEDKESMTAKFNVMKNYGIAGVAGWKLGLESDDIWALIRDNF
jgi:spore germination protein YaaH